MQTPNSSGQKPHLTPFTNSKVLSSANKSIAKKFHSQTKSAVQLIGKLLLSWKSDVYQIEVLLNELQKICALGESVFKEVVIKHPSTMFSGFPEVGPNLLANICSEVESIFVQLKVFE